ncbi:MAG: hypothetical protein AB6733_05855 [Clostridiaceae bacterium]
MELKEALIQYKNHTIELINYAENEEFDFIEDLLNCREYIISIVKTQNYSKEEFTSIVKELGIMELEEKLKSIMSAKKDIVKKEIEKVARNKNANIQYSKKDYSKSLYFNEKI